MIQKIECYVLVCDVCRRLADGDADFTAHYDTEAQALEMALESVDYGGSGCQMVGDKLCCSKCWIYDDNDELAIRPEAFGEAA